MLDNITVNAHSSIRIAGKSIVYIDHPTQAGGVIFEK